MRRNLTDAERAMWFLLKQHFPHARFRRQVPLRHYIVDFASHRLRLMVEVDGGQHRDEADAKRAADIESEGYRVMRFWNNEVLHNGEGCMIRLLQRVRRDHPYPASTRHPGDSRGVKSPHPSPIEGEGG
jgi:very-short-patch-repair endonuclease